MSILNIIAFVVATLFARVYGLLRLLNDITGLVWSYIISTDSTHQPTVSSNKSKADMRAVS